MTSPTSFPGFAVLPVDRERAAVFQQIWRLDDIAQHLAAHRIASQRELVEALEETRACLLDGDDMFSCRASRDDAILEIVISALCKVEASNG